MPDLGAIASLVAVPLATATVAFAWLTWREARATVKPLRLMAEELQRSLAQQEAALAQQRAEHRLEQLQRIGTDVAAVHAELVSTAARGNYLRNSDLQESMRRALVDLRVALQSQPTGALPQCRALVQDMRLEVLESYPEDTAMAALSEVEAALLEAAKG